VLSFLDSKIKTADLDPEKRWITTWNDYLWRIKFFFRWLYNVKIKQDAGEEALERDGWATPKLVAIKKKRTKRLSPYSESEIWERDELFAIIKYEPQKRNKAALALMWDLDARNHEITLSKIKHIKIGECYGEGEIPHEAKTGTGPILLTNSFPYVRDWLNEHPFSNEPEARVICNLLTGSPIQPGALWTVIKQLRHRILRLLQSGAITDPEEVKMLEFLICRKKWNPYCIIHSSITHDSDYAARLTNTKYNITCS
jgi:hypothetical protein